MTARRVFLLGGAGLALGGCFDTPCEEQNPAQKAFLDGLRALAKPALVSNNPLQIEEAAKQSVALAEKVGAFSDWCGTLTRIEGNARQTTLFTFTVTLSAPYDQAVTMSFRTVDGTATTSDGDYIAKTGTLTFAPGETTKTITIEVKGDNKREANETFYLDLFANSSNSLFAKNRGIGTILNDD
jgi:hypothetical protein